MSDIVDCIARRRRSPHRGARRRPSIIDSPSEAVCSLFLLAMIVLIGAEAIARNVFGTSLQITDEVGGYLLVAMTFLSMSVAEAHGAFPPGRAGADASVADRGA